MGEAYSGKYKILDSNTVILFNDSSELKLVIKPSIAFQFTVRIELVEDDTSDDRRITKSVDEDNNLIRITCFNFKQGAGTIQPIELATARGKKIYIHIWVENMASSTTVNKIEYTVYMEE